MGYIKKEMLIGVAISLVATFAGLFIYVEFFSEFDFQKTLQVIKEQELQGKIFTSNVCSLVFVFFVFIKKKQDYRARGVLLTTILIAISILIIKII